MSKTNDKAKKIEGWISEWWRREAEAGNLVEVHQNEPVATNATEVILILHRDKPERLFTESEVVALLDKMRRNMNCLVSVNVMDEFLETAKDAGIVLDPA